MNKTNTRNAVVGGTLVLLLAFIFLCLESRGKLIETRVGLIGIMIIVALLFLSAYLTPDTNNKDPDKQPPPK